MIEDLQPYLSGELLSGGLLFLLALIIVLIFYLASKVQMVSLLKRNINSLNRTIEELDQQAKLIIKSDMEIKLYQEEVADKLNKLALLKEFIFSSLHILDREQLFSQIKEKTIHDLGFKKGAVLNFDDHHPIVNIGFKEKELAAIKNFLVTKKTALKNIPLLSSASQIVKELKASLHSQNILVAPIKTREDISAVFILSHFLTPAEIRRAEREIFAIICMYIGQCLDNISLFEDLYRTKDNLERKVKERTNELIKSLRASETMSKMKSDFISSVSHELRTPLTSVKGFASLLVDEKFGKLPLEAKKRLEKVDENVNKLVNMVNTLLDISRIESGKMEVKISPYDIVKLIKDVGDFFSPQLQAKKIRLVIDTPESLTVYIDKNLIERVLINLINNAVKFTPPGGTITVQGRRKDKRATIAVTDTGCGISKDDLAKIFQEFFRVDNPINRQVKGSGLGLSLVKRIIDTHKEKIWIESEAGKGTAFYFTLRVAEYKFNNYPLAR